MDPEQIQAPQAPPPSAISQTIRGEVLSTLEPRKVACRSTLALGASALLVGGLLLGGLLALLGFRREPAAFQWGMAGTSLAVAVAAFWAGTAKARSGRRSKKAGATLAALLGFAVVVVVGKVVAGGVSAEDPILGCLGLAGLVALFPLAGLLRLLRRTDAMTPGWSAALAGAVTGLVGAGSVSLACPSLDTLHLFVGHGLLVGVLAGASAYLFARLMAP